MPKLTIDGIEIEVEPGTSILQAAEQLGIEVPRFCYHDRLSVPANCRMCLVEVAPGPPKPQASCALACADNMQVKTNSDMVKKARKGVMEMLLVNHPLDCPVCDQGGECDLQDQAVAYGFDRSRYHENKRAVTDKDLGPLVKTVMTRCIQCTRCVRFGEEVAGVTTLGLLNRGEDVEIGTFIGAAVKSELSGNLVDVCPVGALTSRPYEFQARPWELTKTETIDVHDAVGSNIRVDTRGGQVMRVLPRLHEDVNEEWISDKTRYACDGLKHGRIDRPYIRENGALREAGWPEAIALVAARLKAAKPEKTAAFAGDLCAAEEMVALKDIMTARGGEPFLECRIDGAQFDPSERCGYIFNTTIAGIEKADAILLIGTNPRAEAPLVNARIRKAWRKNRTAVGLIGQPCDLTYSCRHIGAGPADLGALAAGGGDFARVLQAAKNPMLILGAGALRRPDAAAIIALARELAEKYGMIREDWNGFNVLHTAASRVGALDIGFCARPGQDASGAEFVWLLGADGLDPDAIGRKAFVVYQGHHGGALAARADVILPGAAYTEKDGLYVNTEGRVQQARRAAYPPGEAREDWKIIRAVAGEAGIGLPYASYIELRARIEKEWPHFGDIDAVRPAPWKQFGAKGQISGGDFAAAVEDFYLTNPICLASPTMKLCSETFVRNDQKNCREAAA